MEKGRQEALLVGWTRCPSTLSLVSEVVQVIFLSFYVNFIT